MHAAAPRQPGTAPSTQTGRLKHSLYKKPRAKQKAPSGFWAGSPPAPPPALHGPSMAGAGWARAPCLRHTDIEVLGQDFAPCAVPQAVTNHWGPTCPEPGTTQPKEWEDERQPREILEPVASPEGPCTACTSVREAARGRKPSLSLSSTAPG